MEEHLVLLPRRSDNVIGRANVQRSWDETSVGLGRFRYNVEMRTTRIVQGLRKA